MYIDVYTYLYIYIHLKPKPNRYIPIVECRDRVRGKGCAGMPMLGKAEDVCLRKGRCPCATDP